MKQFMITLIMSLLVLHLQAQDETLFNNAHVVGAFGGPIVEFSEIKSNFVTSTGGGGGIIIDNFFIGGYGISSTDFDDLFIDDRFRADIAHGGIWVGFTFRKHKIIHPYGSAKIGWGAVDIRFDDNDLDFGDNVFVLSPELGLELNVTRWFRIGATGNYRWVDGVRTNQNISNADYRSFGGGLTFRFGWFGNRHYHPKRYDRDYD